ncbi:hypothetical protein GGTG_10829 [Gaeumannomyces tritici R3-111a-1]|uniref:Uncharacterized protein n=1 Tax=Gaeumannomyces tritici (strain R3-111a-1) TaxID=644352 RepID=J3PBF6_GAET3|nr:hypothetical protein GGTG_10829 [Gaeumannomyces tritici R3-111a-1]EJT71573.1 hypothetical protein GGTG_10829 [Gaeumannomyces tritici R3-111a-1]
MSGRKERGTGATSPSFDIEIRPSLDDKSPVFMYGAPSNVSALPTAHRRALGVLAAAGRHELRPGAVPRLALDQRQAFARREGHGYPALLRPIDNGQYVFVEACWVTGLAFGEAKEMTPEVIEVA